MEDIKRQPRRRHGSELKALVLAECARPGASVAQVAMAHGLNANVVHKWRRQSGRAASGPMRQDVTSFIALGLPAAQPAPLAEIRIELRRGATTFNVSWPMAGAAECAAWMRELLR